MATREQNKMARKIYNEGFDSLAPGEKASVTKKLKAQVAPATVSESAAGVVTAKIGRLGNGVQECALREGATVSDLLRQGHFSLDAKKESIMEKSTGEIVKTSDIVKQSETYIITNEIRPQYI